MNLHINDLFHTHQGEGVHSGRRALFVRMPFCNLSCTWCDTSFNSFAEWSETDFVNFATSEPNRFAVITGGEPMMHKHTPRVVALLKRLGYEIACETNGTFPIVDGIDFVTCSPKRDAEYKVHELTWPKVNEFKYVIDKGFQWEILKRHDLTDGKRYSLSPEFGRIQESLSEIMSYIRDNPGWRISLQTHKWMNIP